MLKLLLTAGIVEHVTLLEFAPEMKADQVLQNKLRSLKNVDIILNAQTTEVKGDGSKVTGLEYRDRVSGDVHSVELAGIFVQIGLLPNTNWLEGAVERNRMGEIIIDAKCETSVKGFSPLVTAPPYHISRSSSRPVKARRPH